MKNMKLVLYAWLVLFFGFTGTACKKDDPKASEETPILENNFVSAKFVAIIPVANIRQLAAAHGYPQFNTDLQFDVTIFSLVYKTMYQGKEIQASGLMCFPR